MAADSSSLDTPPAKKHSLAKPAVEGPLCQSILRGEENCKCPLSHDWSFYNAPTCVQLMSGFCPSGHFCRLGHQHALLLYGTWTRCERFEAMGFCERGADCPKVHLWGDSLPSLRKFASAENEDREAQQPAAGSQRRENKNEVKLEGDRLIKENSEPDHDKKRSRNGRYWEQLPSDGSDQTKTSTKHRRVEEVASGGAPIALGDYVPL